MKKEKFAQKLKRLYGYLYYREFINAKETLFERMESNKFQKQHKND